MNLNLLQTGLGLKTGLSLNLALTLPNKKFDILYIVRGRARYKLSLVLGLSPVCSKFKFMFSVGFQLFSLKTSSHGKSDLKIHFQGHIYHMKWFSGQKVKYLQRT